MFLSDELNLHAVRCLLELEINVIINLTVPFVQCYYCCVETHWIRYVGFVTFKVQSICVLGKQSMQVPLNCSG